MCSPSLRRPRGFSWKAPLLFLLPGLTGAPDGTPPITRGTLCSLRNAAGAADPGGSSLDTVHPVGEPWSWLWPPTPHGAVAGT